jgi:hypothetical protein
MSPPVISYDPFADSDLPVLKAIKNEYTGPRVPRSSYPLPQPSCRYVVLGKCRAKPTMLICVLFHQFRKNGPYSEGQLTAFPINEIGMYLQPAGYISKHYVREVVKQRADFFCRMEILQKNTDNFKSLKYPLNYDIVEGAFGCKLMCSN